MTRQPLEFMGMRRMAVDVDAYRATLEYWSGLLRTWRAETRHPTPRDTATADPFAPTRMTLARRWLPHDPDAADFVLHTLALVNWPGEADERLLGLRGKKLIAELVFSCSPPDLGRPRRLRDPQPERARILVERPALLGEVQQQFRKTRGPEMLAERRDWLRSFLARHLPDVPPGPCRRRANALASKRPVDVVNWLLGARYCLRPAQVQQLSRVRQPGA